MVKRLIINSNDGWQRVELNLIKEAFLDTTKILIANLKIESFYWEQSQLTEGLVGDLVKDRDIVFEQLCLEQKSWFKLFDLIQEWKNNRKLFSCSLYNSLGEEVRFRLTLENDLMLSLEKPSLEIWIKNNRLEFKSLMIIDDTSFSYSPDF